MQSGKPVAVFETHAAAPRVLIANSNLVGRWATWEHFRELDAAGLMMYGQMTAGSWIYIGTQGILQGTYETFAAIARQRFGGTLRGPARRHRRARRDGRRAAARGDHERGLRAVHRGRPAADRAAHPRALPRRAGRLARRRARAPGGGAARGPRALDRAARQRRRGPARARAPRRGGRRRDRPDERARPAQRLRPGRPHARAGRRAARRATPTSTSRASAQSVLAHVDAIRTLGAAGRRGVRLRQRAARRRARSTATPTRSPTPGFVPAYIRPLFCEGKGPFRWVALSGDPADIAATDRAILDLFGDQDAHPALDRAGRASGSRSRACRRGSAGSATASATSPGCASTRWSPRAR